MKTASISIGRRIATATAVVGKFDYRRVFSWLPRPWRTVIAGRTFAPARVLATDPRERGQALIEMALILPLILVFIMVIVDFGIALDRREVIQHGVREGARIGAVGASDTEIIDHTVDQAQGTFVPADVSVCYVDGDDSNSTAGNAGDFVRVSGTFVYNFTVGSNEMLGMFGVDSDTLAITMTPMAEARLETSVSGATACP